MPTGMYRPNMKISELTPIEQQVVHYIISEKAQQVYQNLERFRGYGLEKTIEIIEKAIDDGTAKLVYNKNLDTIDIKFFNKETGEYDI